MLIAIFRVLDNLQQICQGTLSSLLEIKNVSKEVCQGPTPSDYRMLILIVG